MKIIEYGHYDLASNEVEVKDCVMQALRFQPNTISVLPYYVKSIKGLVVGHADLSCVIDYPFGVSDTQSRITSLEQSIKDGVDIVELVMCSPLLCNRKYDKLRKELDFCTKLCNDHAIELRFILEYKIFAADLLYKAASLLQEFNITTIYPSANFLIDSISDNILAGMLIQQKNPSLKIIFNGSAWTDEQLDMVLNNTNIYGYKTSNIYTLEKLYQKIH